MDLKGLAGPLPTSVSMNLFTILRSGGVGKNSVWEAGLFGGTESGLWDSLNVSGLSHETRTVSALVSKVPHIFPELSGPPLGTMYEVLINSAKTADLKISSTPCDFRFQTRRI